MKKSIALILLALMSSLLYGINLSGYYFGAGSGLGYVDSGIKYIDSSSKIDSMSRSWKIYAGYDVSPHFSIEAHYSQFGDSIVNGKRNDTYVYDGVYRQFSEDIVITSQSNSFGLSGIVHSKNLGRFSTFAKLGLHSWRTHFSNSGKGYDGNGDERSLNLSYGVGIKYKVNSFLNLRLEFDKYEFNNKYARMSTFGTEIQGDLIEVILKKLK